VLSVRSRESSRGCGCCRNVNRYQSAGTQAPQIATEIGCRAGTLAVDIPRAEERWVLAQTARCQGRERPGGRVRPAADGRAGPFRPERTNALPDSLVPSGLVPLREEQYSSFSVARALPDGGAAYRLPGRVRFSNATMITSSSYGRRTLYSRLSSAGQQLAASLRTLIIRPGFNAPFRCESNTLWRRTEVRGPSARESSVRASSRQLGPARAETRPPDFQAASTSFWLILRAAASVGGNYERGDFATEQAKIAPRGDRSTDSGREARPAWLPSQRDRGMGPEACGRAGVPRWCGKHQDMGRREALRPQRQRR
jgi:hypothetical protein